MFHDLSSETGAEALGTPAHLGTMWQDEQQLSGNRGSAGEDAASGARPAVPIGVRPWGSMSRGCEQRQKAVAALAALGTDRGIEVFRYLTAASPMALAPVLIARELGLTVRAVSAELGRLSRVGLVGHIGSGRKKAFFADTFRARLCLEQVHALAEVLAPC